MVARAASLSTHRQARALLFALAVSLPFAAACGRSRRTVAAIDAGAPDAGEVEACLFFVRSVCNKLFFECRGAPDDSAPCPPNIDSTCPDRYFSPGSTTEVATLVACAAEWQAMSCDDLRNGVRPECIPHGERDEGDACVFGAQCSSGFCAAPTLDEGLPGCGVCERVAGLGEPCEGEPVRCADGLECHGSCEPSPPFGLPLGSACERLGQCASGTFCLTLAGEEAPTCQPAPRVGDDCPIDTPYCEGNCDAEGVCRPAPTAGEPCALSANDAHICEEGLRCELEAAAGPLCGLPLGLGDGCKPLNADFSSGGCEPGALCHCADAACELGTCVRRRDLGETCDGEHDVCLAGTACEDGRCEPSGPQDRFQLACSE